MSSNIFTEIDKVKIDLSPPQIAELSKFPAKVIQYVNSCSQNFINFDIFHQQCNEYSKIQNILPNTQFRDKILDILKKREQRHKKISRSDYFEKYNMLFNDNVGVK